jgi:hypothetical protein
VTISPQLQLAAEWHTDDVLNGSTAQTHADAAGFKGTRARWFCQDRAFLPISHRTRD